MGGQIVDTIMESLPLNSRIRVGLNVGTVKFIGEVTGYPGIWIGVEWDTPDRGKHDGTVNGTKYFDTNHLNSGSMIRPEKIEKFENVREAIENRYNLLDDAPIDEKLFKATQKESKASIFEFVGLENIRNKQSHLETLTDISIPYSNVSYAGDLAPFKRLSFLQLSDSLISSWKTVAEIVKQLPKLTDLDLTRNVLQQPNEMEIVDLEPSFRNLKNINLSKNNLTWMDVMYLSDLWPSIEQLALRSNRICSFLKFDQPNIFTHLRELDLECNDLWDFKEIIKLGFINTLTDLNLAGNKIERLELPDCLPNERLNIFKGLKKINIKQNPIIDMLSTFNELDKMPALNYLLTQSVTESFDVTFSNAVSRMSLLTTINYIQINEENRRGAEYDLWKAYGTEWINASDNEKQQFFKKCRAYPRLIKKYGSPADLIILPPKTSNLITIKIQMPTKVLIKRLPKKISVQTLQGIIIKMLNCDYQSSSTTMLPILTYIDANKPDIKVHMDNLSRNLDFYSIQDGDTVLVE